MIALEGPAAHRGSTVTAGRDGVVCVVKSSQDMPGVVWRLQAVPARSQVSMTVTNRSSGPVRAWVTTDLLSSVLFSEELQVPARSADHDLAFPCHLPAEAPRIYVGLLFVSSSPGDLIHVRDVNVVEEKKGRDARGTSAKSVQV